jgi:hypothetical protein
MSFFISWYVSPVAPNFLCSVHHFIQELMVLIHSVELLL